RTILPLQRLSLRFRRMVDGSVGSICPGLVLSRWHGDDRVCEDRSSMTYRQDAGPTFESRVRGLLHGVAFGDAIGAPVEKLTPAEIRAMYGWVNSLDNEWHRTSRDPAAGNGRVRGNGIV